MWYLQRALSARRISCDNIVTAGCTGCTSTIAEAHPAVAEATGEGGEELPQELLLGAMSCRRSVPRRAMRCIDISLSTKVVLTDDKSFIRT